jgi:radical SAM protein (TIGR01212 family)
MKLYNDYNSYLRERYGCKVYRIGLDAGFTCPNRDGTKGVGGCIYCNADGSRASYAKAKETIGWQLESRMVYLKKYKKARKFIAYFQAFTNTYGPTARLKEAYDKVLKFDDIVGISIGTRPDTIDREKLKLISSYKERYEVWIEYGLQSVHDRTLKTLNRMTDFADFVAAVGMTKEYGLKVSAHVILGLPGETRDDMLQTAGCLSELGIDGVKIHLLHVLKGSALEEMYRQGKVRLLDKDEYVGLVCDFLENLSSDVIIQRITGEGEKSTHVAPAWALDKTSVIQSIEEVFLKRGTRQGSCYLKV